MKTVKQLEQADAEKMLAAAVAKAKSLGIALSIAVTDAGGDLLAFVRMDGTTALIANLAVKKAWTSAKSQSPTKLWMERAETFPGMLSFPDIVLMQGGLPVMVDGHCIGAVGASGAPPAQDEEAAQAAIDALG